MNIRSILSAFLSLWLMNTPALAQLLASGGTTPFGPGSPGFLSTCSANFTVQNNLLHSQTFASWSKLGTGAASPTITDNAVAAPDSTMTAAEMDIPAVSGANNRSIIYETSGAFSNWPETYDIYVKGAVGGETIWIEAEPDGSNWVDTKIVATTSWVRYSLSWANKVNGSAFNFHIGVDLVNPHQSAQSAQTVYIWGAQGTNTTTEWNYIPTTNSQVSQTQNFNCPAGTAFRDFSTLTAYVSNPLIPQNTGSYNAGGVNLTFAATWAKIGSTYYGLANCTVSGGSRGNWPNLCLYTSTNLSTNWTDASASNPILTGSAGWDATYILHAFISPTSCSVATWCAYYSANPGSSDDDIGLMTSSNLTTWTRYGSSPLTLSTTNATQPNLPSIVQIGSTLYMYASVTAFSHAYEYICFWTSPVSDGVNWTFGGLALNRPTSVDWDYDGGNSSQLDPQVFKNSHGFYEMAYTYGYSGGQKVGYAVSGDGITWYRYGVGAIIAQSSSAYPGTVAYIGDTIFTQDGTHFNVIYGLDNNSNSAFSNLAQMTDY